MATLTSTAGSPATGYIISAQGSPFSVPHNATDGASISCASIFADLNYVAGGTKKWKINRGFMPFATSGIPSTATLASGTVGLHIFLTSDILNDGSDFVVIVGSTTQANASGLVIGDFDMCGAITNPVECSDRKDITSLASGANYSLFTLNTSGLAVIMRTGSTLFGIREGHDVTNYVGAATAGDTGVSALIDSQLNIYYALGTTQKYSTILHGDSL